MLFQRLAQAGEAPWLEMLVGYAPPWGSPQPMADQCRGAKPGSLASVGNNSVVHLSS